MKDNEKLNDLPEGEQAAEGLDIPEGMIIDEEPSDAAASEEEQTSPEEAEEEASGKSEDEAEEEVPEAETQEAKPAKVLKNIFSELDDPDAEDEPEDGPAPEESAEPEPEEQPAPAEEPAPDSEDDAQRRRRMIEHRRNDALSAEEIAARKKAHAERHSKNAGNGKKKKKPGTGKGTAAGKGKGKNAGRNAPLKKKTSAVKKDGKKSGGKLPDDNFPFDKEKPSKAAKPEEETVDMQDFRRARNKLKNRKRTKRLIVLLVIAVIAAGVYFTKGLWIPKLEGILDKPRETIVNDSTEQAGNFPLDTGDSTVTQITRLDGSIVTADSGHITTYDTNGKLRDSSYHGCGRPELRSCGKRMLCFDFGGTAFKLYGKSGLVFEKQAGGTVLLGNIASNGNVAVAAEDSKYTVSVNVYDKNGDDVYQWSNGDRVLDLSFTGDGNGLIVTTFGASGGKLSSTVHRIDLTKSGSVTDSDKIEGFILKTCETSDGNIWAMGEDRLWLLSQSCRMLDSFEFSTEPVSFDLCSEGVCAACNNVSGGTTVYVFSSEDLELKPAQIESTSGSIKKVRCFDGMAFVLSSDKLDAYAPDGKLVSTAAVSNEHSDFVYSENAAYFIDRHEVSKLIFRT